MSYEETSDWTKRKKIGLYLTLQNSQASSTLTCPRWVICALVASQMGKVDFQLLELQEFLHQHVQYLRTQYSGPGRLLSGSSVFPSQRSPHKKIQQDAEVLKGDGVS